MSEVDTFNALKKTPFSEMRLLIVKNSESTICNRLLLEKNGWTVEEYRVKWYKWLRDKNDITRKS